MIQPTLSCRLGFGGASIGNLGSAVEGDDASGAVDRAIAKGMRFFDTAPFYGLGLSERRLGDALRGRENILVCTKAGRLLRPATVPSAGSARHGFIDPLPFDPVYDYSFDGIMRSHEDSLQRLGLPRIDYLLAHDLGERTHGSRHGETWRQFLDGGLLALERLRATGAIRGFGLGVNEWQVCVEAMRHARFDLFMLAGRYTLLDHSALAVFLPAAQAHGASVIAAGVYNSGILVAGSRSTGASFDYRPAPPDILERTARIEQVCRRFDVVLPAAALQFVLAHPGIDAVVAGICSARRVDETFALADGPIPAEFWQALRDDGLIPGEAPVPNAGTGNDLRNAT